MKEERRKKRLIAVIERQDGSLFEQEIQFFGDFVTSAREAKKILGKGYWICDVFWR